MAAVTLVAAYDVTRDDRRARLAALLQATGDRLQRSVFLVTIDSDDLDDLQARAAAVIDPDQDSLYLFRQCASCWDDVVCVGQADPPEKTLFWAAL